MSVEASRRALDRIELIAARADDLVTMWRESSEVLATAVPHYQAPCWYTLDPASLLITSHYNPDVPQFPQEWLTHEYYGDDVNTLVDVARSDSGVATLHEATGGDPSSSRRWRENMQYGADQELIARLRTKGGEVWGALSLYREPGAPTFTSEEKAFVAEAARHWAMGARRTLLLADAREPEGPNVPGLLILTADFEVESATPGVARWLADLPDGDWDGGTLPSSVLAVAGQALRQAPGQPDAGTALSRVRCRSGSWVVLHGAGLVSDGQPRVAVIVQPADPARVTPLLMSAYGLTDREQEVTLAVLKGESTLEIASGLVVSAHTVQQHLKSVFEKTGVRSRRDLVGKVFFAHYEPRLRDNERRAVDGLPLRGAPLVAP